MIRTHIRRFGLFYIFSGAAVFALVIGFARSALAHTRITTDISWSKDIRPIFREKCMTCHSPGGVAPVYVDLTTYGKPGKPGARDWAKAIEEEVMTGRMPPWSADPRFENYSNDRRLTPQEKDYIVAWLQGGTPQGPDRDLPPPDEFMKRDWTLGRPDLEIVMPEEVIIPANSTELTHTFVSDVPASFGKDDKGEEIVSKWITGYEFFPGNGPVVYRMTAFILDPEGLKQDNVKVEVQKVYDPLADEGPEEIRERAMPLGRRFLGQWSRGDAPVFFPPESGKRLHAGSKIEMTIEYRKMGLEDKGVEFHDLSRLGLFFAVQPVEYVVESSSIGSMTTAFRLIGGTLGTNAEITLDEAAHLTSIHPMLSPLTKQFELRAFYPDGKEKILLSISNYDRRWPSSFQFEAPITAPAKTRLEMKSQMDSPKLDQPAMEHPFLAWIDYTLDDHLWIPTPVPTPAQIAKSEESAMVFIVPGDGPVSDAEPPSDGPATDIVVPEEEAEAQPPAKDEMATPKAGGEKMAAHARDAAAVLPTATPVPIDLTGKDPTKPKSGLDENRPHGGKIFALGNTYHRVEAALPFEDEFRLYVHDNQGQVIDPRNFAGHVTLKSEAEPQEFKLQYMEFGNVYLAADIPPIAKWPANFDVAVWIAGQKQNLNVGFERVTRDLAVDQQAQLPPADQSPLHGGKLIISENRYHYLEGALAARNKFRVYFYDNTRQPLDPRNFAGEVIFENLDDASGQLVERKYPLAYREYGDPYLMARFPNIRKLPVDFKAKVSLAGRENTFSFAFDALSRDPSQEMSAQMGHMDHTPVHGGLFIMADDLYHHLEGTLPAADEFRLYYFGTNKQPLDARNFKGEVVFESFDEKTEQITEQSVPLAIEAPGQTYAIAKIPPIKEFPVDFNAKVWMGDQESTFSFAFEGLTKPPDLRGGQIIAPASSGIGASTPNSTPNVAAGTVAAAFIPHEHNRRPVEIPSDPVQIVREIVARDQEMRAIIDADKLLDLFNPPMEAKEMAEALQRAGLKDLDSANKRKLIQACQKVKQGAIFIHEQGHLQNKARLEQQAYKIFSEGLSELLEIYPGAK